MSNYQRASLLKNKALSVWKCFFLLQIDIQNGFFHYQYRLIDTFACWIDNLAKELTMSVVRWTVWNPILKFLSSPQVVWTVTSRYGYLRVNKILLWMVSRKWVNCTISLNHIKLSPSYCNGQTRWFKWFVINIYNYGNNIIALFPKNNTIWTLVEYTTKWIIFYGYKTIIKLLKIN